MSPSGRSAWRTPYFAAAEPEELLYDEIEAIWAAIAERDDWTRFKSKLVAIDEARAALGLTPGAA